MSAADPYEEFLRHQFIPDGGAGNSPRGTCFCGNRMSYNSAGHLQHLLEVVKPIMEAREREVIAATANVLLDVIVKAGVVLSHPESPFAEFGESVLLLAEAADARFGCDSTHYRTVGYALGCDHRGCRNQVQAPTMAFSRQAAAHLGWHVAIGDGQPVRLTDFCPEHRASAEAQA